MSVDVERGNITLTAVHEDGQEEKYRGLFTFQSEKTGKTYLAFTEDTDDDGDEINVYVGILVFKDDEVGGEELQLEAIETDEEQAIVDDLLDKVDEQFFFESLSGGFNEYAWRLQQQAKLDRNAYCDAPHDDDD